MDVARDLLDKLVLDRDGRAMGRVDGVLLEAADGAPPRLTTIVIGPAALAHRLHPRLGLWIRSLERFLGLPNDRPVHITTADIDTIERHVTLHLRVDETSVEAVELRLRTWIQRIPGGR